MTDRVGPNQDGYAPRDHVVVGAPNPPGPSGKFPKSCGGTPLGSNSPVSDKILGLVIVLVMSVLGARLSKAAPVSEVVNEKLGTTSEALPSV